MKFENRLVLKPDYERSELLRVAWDLDWDVVDFRRKEAGALIDIWVTYDGRVEIHFVDDRPIGMRYITLRGEGGASVVAQLMERCDLWSFSEATDRLRIARSRVDKLVAIHAAALTAPKSQDDSLVNAYREFLEDPDAGVRQALTIAAGYVPWPGLLGLVEHLRDHDPVGHVRENARILLEGTGVDFEG
ncbi:hypothetical protein GCM10022225_59130 [Plantactinospora mayteni]|uniref:HEAT repeat domain-containing protein n=1 Tax=Plantactinospora mayteni TaxID=566021 RepID=A0ABQ4ELY8_9ACTN|nr:hypothetical protein [Plantactinospora mayteni]GIG95236.1 hypothetical protein Pma05_18090 [Plantactinospora mayteni]